jgi:prophage regulatory protein
MCKCPPAQFLFPPGTPQIIRRRRVEEITGLSKSQIYVLMADGLFPQSVSIGGGRAVGWYLHEILEFIATRKRVPLRRLAS